MKKIINLGNKESALETLHQLKDNKYDSLDVKITNTHIRELNKTLKRTVFIHDTIYVSAITLWEIMQPLGGKGKHHYHNLTPEIVYEALSTMRYSENVTLSYDDRYVIVTLATIENEVNIVAVVTPSGTTQNTNNDVIKIITLYPHK